MVWVVSTRVTLIFPYTPALTSSASGSGALTSVSGSGAGSAVTQGMEQLASIQGYSCLQFLITCHMQRWKGQGLGDLVTCIMSDRQVDVMGNDDVYFINFMLTKVIPIKMHPYQVRKCRVD